MIHVPFTGNLSAVRKIRTLHRIDVTENGVDPGGEARVQIKDTNSTGVLYCDIRLAAKESKHIQFVTPFYLPGGLYVQISAGSVRGSVTGE
jgi:hypothetical protein